MFEILKEHKGFWKIIFKLAKSDLIKTYRGSALGWAWAIIKPSVTIFVYWFTFSVGLGSSKLINGYPYFLWLVSGMVPWFFMSEMITQGTGAIRSYSHLVTKMSFPVSTISTFISISKIMIHFLLLLIVLLLFLAFGFSFDIYYLQIPFYILAMMILFRSWVQLASPLGAISKDFANLVNSFVIAIFWMSGIMWDYTVVHNRYVQLFFKLNPITYISTGYRDVFINKVWFFEKPETLYFMGVLVFLILLSNYVYIKLRKEIPDTL